MNLDELQVNLRDLRIGNGAKAEHLPEENAKGPNVTLVVHLRRREIDW